MHLTCNYADNSEYFRSFITIFIPWYAEHKKYSASLLCLLHGLKPAKLFHLISENSHMAIYFIYFIFNKMVQWALATLRYKFQSVFKQRRQSISDLLCCESQLESRNKVEQQWKWETGLIKPQWRESKLSPGSRMHCLYNTRCRVQHMKSSLIRLTAKRRLQTRALFYMTPTVIVFCSPADNSKSLNCQQLKMRFLIHPLDIIGVLGGGEKLKTSKPHASPLWHVHTITNVMVVAVNLFLRICMMFKI